MNHTMPQIAVIIPTFNRKQMVAEAALSACKQSLRPHEVWIIDDGSTDGTLAFIETHSQLQPYLQQNLLKLHSQKNRGVSAARNCGIQLSSAEWVAFLDSDDLWYKKKLEKQWQVLQESPGLRIVHCNERWEKNGRHLNQLKRHQKSAGDFFERSLELCLVSPSAAVIQRSLLQEMQGFDESLTVCEDYDLWLRIGARELFAFAPQTLLLKRGGHADQLSHSVPHMDLTRVHILANLLEKHALSSRKAQQTHQALLNKLAIMIQGCQKQNKTNEIKDLLLLQEKFMNHQPDILKN